MNRTFSALAAFLMLAACSAAARQSETAAAAEPGYTPPQAPAIVEPPALAPSSAAPPVIHAASSQAHAQMRALSCDVRTRATPNGVLVSANAHSDRDVSGEYEMIITKSGGGNSADINQGGPFSIHGGSSTNLGETEIGLERNARVRVTLRLTGDDGQTCTRNFRL